MPSIAPLRKGSCSGRFSSRASPQCNSAPGDLDEALPLELTIAAMDEGGVDVGLTAPWYGPKGSLIDNDEVAAFVAH